MNFFSACGNVQQTLLILLLLATAVLQLFLAIEDVAGGRYLLTVFDSVLLTAELLYVKTLFEMRTQTAGMDDFAAGCFTVVCGSRAACLCRSQIYSYVDEDALFPVEGYDERGR